MNEETLQKIPPGMLMKPLGVIIGMALIGAIGWYGYTSGWLDGKSITAADVVDRISTATSFRYDSSFQISGKDFSVDVALKGTVDNSNKQNPQSAVSVDATISATEFSKEPIKIGFETRSIGDTAYVRLKSISGLTALGIEVSQSKWIRVNAEDIAKLQGTLGMPPTPSSEVGTEKITEIGERYTTQLLDLAKKYDLAHVTAIRSSERMDGEGTNTMEFTLDEEATVSFAKEAFPLYLSLIKEVFPQMPLYSAFIGQEEFTLTEEEYQEMEKRLREFFAESTHRFTATWGKRSAHLYRFGFDMDINDPKTQEMIKISGSVALSDYDKSFIVEVPTATVPLQEFFGGLMGGSPTKSFGDANNAQRQSNINTILNSINQYQVDNAGKLPISITTSEKEICMTKSANCTGLIDLSVLTKDTIYLVEIPKDPHCENNVCGGGSGTGYMIVKSASGRITVRAPRAENGAVLSVTR